MTNTKPINQLSILILLGCTIFFSSCPNKIEIPFQPKSITELTSNLTGELKDRMILRLAFAKAVANALEDMELREYIYQVSKENTKSFFNELVFAIHKDDKVVGNKSLETVITEAVDKEITDFYGSGSDFIKKVLAEDPLVSIKIPDIFYDLSLEIEKYAPMVLTKTPDYISDDQQIESYISYHYSGFQEVNNIFNKPKYFSIVVKYSEDYILYDKEGETNEKNVNIFYILPQFQKHWNSIKNKIENLGTPYFNDENKIFLNKLDLFGFYSSNYEPQNSHFGDFSNCMEVCKRDCLTKDSINNVLLKLKIDPKIIDKDIKSSVLFEENYNLLFFLSKTDQFGQSVETLDKYALTGLRKKNYVDRNLKLELSIFEKTFENIGTIRIPELNYTYEYSNYQAKNISLNHLLLKGWGEEKQYYSTIVLTYTQNDLLNFTNQILFTKLPEKIVFSDAFILGQYPMDYCDDPGTEFYTGSIYYTIIY